jgi:HAD superfamily hydrolase (TIGR01459 family)
MAKPGKVVLITNAPVPTRRVTAVFDRVGVPHDIFDDCATSGDATRNELVRRKPSSVWIYAADGGLEHDRFLYEGLGLKIECSPAADLVLCIGLRDQFGDHPEDYRAGMKDMAAAGLTMICANPDIQVRVGDRLGWCAGALAAIYEELGGKVVYPGKPHPAIYRLAFDKLGALGAMPDRSRILAIGDGPVTDIRGANREGLDCLYVGTGLAQHDGGDFAGQSAHLLARQGVSATYAMEMLKW